jgi:prefoldin subunit 5
VTLDGSSFFVGLYQLNQQLGIAKSNLTTINNTMNNLQSSSANMTTISTAANNALVNIAKIPNNVNAGGNMAAINYNTPLNSASPTGTTSSTFPALLGSSTTGGFVGSLYTTTTAVNSAISAIGTAAGNFVAQATTFSTSIAALQSTISNFTSFIANADTSFG